ncbi:MAG: hypothetical protein ACYCY6_00295 [Minisyncoccota bacterium]
MKKYLSELPNKSPKHKKRFAILVSGTFTLIVFTLWSMVNLSDEPQVVKDNTGPVNLAATIQSTPLENIFDNIKDSWGNLTKLLTDKE